MTKGIPMLCCAVLCLVAQSCPILCNPMRVACQGPLAMGILQARIMEWIAISFSSNLPDPGIEPASVASPELASRFVTTAQWLKKMVLKNMLLFSSSVVSNFCDPLDCSMPGFPVYHQLPGFDQTNVHRVGDAIQPSYLLLSPSLPAFHFPQHQGLFQWVSSSHQIAKLLELQLQHQSFQWIFRVDFL